MSAAVGKAVARKLVSRQQRKVEEQRLAEGRDPFFYLETDRRGRQKKRAKSKPGHYPDYIPLEDRERLNSFRKYAKTMDTAFFGQFGFDAIIGLVPVAGDVIAAGIAQQLVQRYANKVSCGLPAGVHAKMYRNIVIDLGIGLVPFVGDIADAIWKANEKNLILLEDFLRDHYGPKGAAGVPKPAEPEGVAEPGQFKDDDYNDIEGQHGVRPLTPSGHGRAGHQPPGALPPTTGPTSRRDIA